MGHRLSKIYTRTGDDGSTGLSDRSRISKHSPRMQAIGAIEKAGLLKVEAGRLAGLLARIGKLGIAEVEKRLAG